MGKHFIFVFLIFVFSIVIISVCFFVDLFCVCIFVCTKRCMVASFIYEKKEKRFTLKVI